MTGTLRKLAVLMAAALVGPALAMGSVALAQSAGASSQSAGSVGPALTNTRVTLLAGAPGSGQKVVASGPASQFVQGAPSASGARYVKLDVAGHSASFAMAGTAGASAPIRLAVSGVPGAAGKGQASLDTVATLLYEAVHGRSPAVLLARGQGAAAVTFAVYDPAKPSPNLKVQGASEAMVVVSDHVTTYQVRPTGSGFKDLTIASGTHKGQQLSEVIG